MASPVVYVRTNAAVVTRAGLVVAGVGSDGSTTLAVLPSESNGVAGAVPWSSEAAPLGIRLPPLQHAGTLRANRRGDAVLSVGPAGVFAVAVPPVASWGVEALSAPPVR
jgi:hypothetical protein